MSLPRTRLSVIGELTDVGARHGGRLVVEVSLDDARSLATRVGERVEVRPSGSFSAKQLDAACDDLAEQVNSLRHALEVVAEMLRDGDVDGVLAHVAEVLRG